MFTVGSLFAGVGGFDLGMERAGFKVLWQAEWDKHCQSVLRRHWPDSTLYGDVTDVNGAEIAPVNVITFGSPCQDLSVAGKRAGLDGGRSSMFFQAIRIIKEMRNATNGVFPQIAIWENVPGALSTNKGADFGVVLDSLADIGAVAIEWAVLDAQHFRVPQRRRRVFVVAVFDPAVAERCPDPLLPIAEGRRRDSAKGKPKGKDVATSLADRVGSDSGEQVNITTGVAQPVTVFQPGTMVRLGGGVWEDGPVPTLRAEAKRGDNEPHVAQPIAFESTGGSWGVNAGELSPPIKIGSNLNIPSPPAVAQPVDFSVQYAVRRLTPLETERLMGWPDNHTRWTDDGREQVDSHRYRQCGNGVATPVAAWIGRQILSLLDQPS